MDLRIAEVRILCELLDKVGVATNSKAVVPELGCVLITASKIQVTFFATTGHHCLTVPVSTDCVTIEEEGQILVNYPLLGAALSSLKGAVRLYTKGKICCIDAGGTDSRELVLADPDTLPRAPLIKGVSFDVDAEVIKRVISGVKFAMIEDGSRPELLGIYLGDVGMCGDGIRLATFDLNLNGEMTIPAAVIEPLFRVLPEAGTLSIVVGDRWIQMAFESGVIFSFVKLQQDFPASANAVSKKYRSMTPLATLVIDKSEAQPILTALQEYVNASIRLGIPYATFSGDGQSARVLSSVASMGKFDNVLPTVSYIGAAFDFILSPKRLLDILSNAPDTDQVEIKIYSNKDPLLVSIPNSEDWYVVQGVMGTAQSVKQQDEEDDF